MVHPVGTAVWLEFNTNNYTTATEFYGQLCGWTFQPQGSEVHNYAMIRTQDGALVGGLMDVSELTGPEGNQLPSVWGVYLAVDDVDKRCELATQHGGAVILPPSDAKAAGRFAIVLDNNRYPIGMWQAGTVDGYEFTGKHGSPIWFELITGDFAASRKFYSSVFDAQLVDMDTGDDNFRYATNGSPGSASWGLWDASDFMPDDRFGWRLYFCVDSSKEAEAKVKELGGTIIDGPEDSPFGRILTARDPEGAYFQLNAVSEVASEAHE